MKKAVAVHVRTNRQVVERRVLAVIERLDVSIQGAHNDIATVHQALHAVQFALEGPPDRDDDDYLHIHADEAVALVRALLPFFDGARRRPGVEQ